MVRSVTDAEALHHLDDFSLRYQLYSKYRSQPLKTWYIKHRSNKTYEFYLRNRQLHKL